MSKMKIVAARLVIEIPIVAATKEQVDSAAQFYIDKLQLGESLRVMGVKIGIGRTETEVDIPEGSK